MSTNQDFKGIGLLNHFSLLEDPRINRKKLYPLDEILLVALTATICGGESWYDFALFGAEKLEFLREFLPFKNGIPSHDTFARISSIHDPNMFAKCFINWVKSFGETVKQINIDGKTLRHSFDKAGGKSAIHILNAFASESRIALGQIKVNAKSNEITAIPELLKLLSIKGTIVTIDAIGCQKKIAQDTTEKGADYILALKKNQGELYEQVNDFFTLEEKNSFRDIEYSYHQEEPEKGHGRIEKRECWVVSNINWINKKDDWQGLTSIVMVRATRIIADKTTVENRFYLSSLGANAKLIGRSVRRHWSIENSLHWVLDVTLGEDNSRIRTKNAPENMALVRKIALNMIRRVKANSSIKGMRKAAGWNNDVLRQILLYEDN